MTVAIDTSSPEYKWRRFAESRLMGMRTNRYSWWVHWRDLADYFMPRRYKWVVTPNAQSRGSQINQHILDSTGVIAARNCASGLMSGKTSPARPWFSLRLGKLDSTGNNPVSLWLSGVERIMRLVFHESNFYNSIAQFYYDLVIFGTAVLIIYEDYENVIICRNPCAGEYYVDIDGNYRPCILYMEYTMTIAAVVDEFGYENCSIAVKQAYDLPGGAGLTREIIVAQAIEPNNDGRDFGIPTTFEYRECFWEWGGSQSPQGGSSHSPTFLRTKGYHEQPNVTVRWDLVSNDPYGRSPGMDALPDQKQLQLETKRKAQGIDKMVNPPLVADAQLKNQPASLLPGGMTYVNGYTSSGKPGIASIYDTKFPVNEIREDLAEVRQRIKDIFFEPLFRPISQFETRSNVTAVEIDQRKAEALIMLGPVFERLDDEGLKVVINRVYNICARVPGLFPEAPPEVQGLSLNVEFTSMLALAQDALQAASIERLFGFVGNMAGVVPDVIDKVNTDNAIDEYSTLLRNDPRILRSDEEVGAIREQRAKQNEMAQQAAIAEQLAKGAKTLSQADLGGGTNALQAVTGSPVQ